MEIVYRLERATVAQVFAELRDAPSYNAVRAALRLLEENGHLRHDCAGPRYVYVPTVPARRARREALRGLVRTYFGGSPERLVHALVEDEHLSTEELERLERLIDQTRKERTRS